MVKKCKVLSKQRAQRLCGLYTAVPVLLFKTRFCGRNRILWSFIHLPVHVPGTRYSTGTLELSSTGTRVLESTGTRVRTGVCQ